jgi:inosine/xanthosine triphosphatase
MFPDIEFSVDGFSVPSGVPDQPVGCDQTLAGAMNRAKRLTDIAEADYFVGIEGGIETIDDTLFANAWIVVFDRDGNLGRGRSGSFPLPEQVKSLIDEGMELGHANDQVFGQSNSKQAGGAVGALTGGAVSRQALYEHAMLLALVPFRQINLYR